jgi:hypothetical protein
MANLHYLAADSLNMALKFRDGKIWGNERKSFSLGPWNLDVWLHVRSDVVDKNECGLWVSLTKRLWLYLMIDKKGTRIVVFDAKKYGITLDSYQQFGGTSVRETFQSLGKAAKAMYVYHEDVGWAGAQLAS